MDYVYLIVVGIIAGWLTGLVLKGKGFGLIGNAIVGCLGALFGAFLFRLLGIAAYNLAGSVLMALTGAVALLYLIGLARRA
jgi:uncharacterized membrane protein YeaQ/YmgE (transglycosylase-associated protein family)